MNDMTTRTAPIDKRGVLEAFAKLLAPRPEVYVFKQLPGWQYAAVEMPETHQVLLGVSVELWHYIDTTVAYETGHGVGDHIKVHVVHEGNSVKLFLTPRPQSALRYEPFVKPFVEPRVLELAPKPIGAAQDGQPSGFTQEDVDVLRRAAGFVDERDEEAACHVHRVADRIAARLPPVA